MKVLIDGDILRYRIGFACQKTSFKVYSEPVEGMYTLIGEYDKKSDIPEDLKDYAIVTSTVVDPIANIKHSLKLQINSIIEGAEANEYRIYISGKNNFRDKIAVTKPYKGNRSGRKPASFDLITDILLKDYHTILVDGIEADDAMGIVQTKDVENTIIASIDKDLNMIPGWHYDFVKRLKYYVDEVTAHLWFYCQMIMGDTVDNIQGILGAGKKAAYDILKDAGEGCSDFYNMDVAIRTGNAYKKYYKEDWHNKWNENAALLRILRSEDEIPIDVRAELSETLRR